MLLMLGNLGELVTRSLLLDFETLGDQETIFNQLYHIFHPQKHMIDLFVISDKVHKNT